MKRNAFTLIELLVVIAILGVLAALLIPAVNAAMKKGQMSGVMANGRSIHQSLVAASDGADDLLPRSTGSGSFATSTDYWRWIITNRVMDATFAIFGAPGMAQNNTTDGSTFTEANNAWCAAADLVLPRNDTPFLFTRNLGVANLSETLDGKLTDRAPFGMEGVVLVTAGGSGFVVKPLDLPERFNPVNASNTVLRP